MRKSGAILGSAVFFAIAPFTLGFIVPWWMARCQMAPPFFGNPACRLVGLLLVIIGLVPLLESFGRFALVGLGTPAPVAPPKHLVVTGFYRYVRNPMYVGVLLAVVGNGLILGNVSVLGYGVIVAVSFNLFVLAYEEPTLARQFGADYAEFSRNVPRWWPRLTPWTPARRE